MVDVESSCKYPGNDRLMIADAFKAPFHVRLAEPPNAPELLNWTSELPPPGVAAPPVAPVGPVPPVLPVGPVIPGPVAPVAPVCPDAPVGPVIARPEGPVGPVAPAPDGPVGPVIDG